MSDTKNRALAIGKTLDERVAELRSNPDIQIRKQFPIDATAKAIDPETRTARFTITTAGVDRDNDTVAVDGWDVASYQKSPVVLWAHDYSQMPVARAIDLVQTAKGLEATAEFPPKGTYAFADTVFDMLKGGFLSATSVGFRPKNAVPNTDRQGIDFLEQELLEFSIVPVPANPEALIMARSKGINVEPLCEWAEKALSTLHGKGAWVKAESDEKCKDCEAALVDGKCPKCSAKMHDYGQQGAAACADCKGELTDGVCPACQAQGRAVPLPVFKIAGAQFSIENDCDEVRWNRQLSKAFDVAGEPCEASRTELAWVSRYLEAPVQHISQSSEFVPSARMGSYLSALDERIAGFTVEAVRNLTESGREAPPVAETIQLNSTTRRQFLIEGTRFMRRADGLKLALKLEPVWSGLHVTMFADQQRSEQRNDFAKSVSDRAAKINYLRGEAFRLSGEFLDRGDMDFSGLFLEPKKEAPIRRLVDAVNEEGEHMPSRGVVLMGPPGTGKTLAGRVIMRQAESTFIWVSARDLHRSGAFGGLSYAFDIATECAPSVLFIEDVDNYLDSYVIDMLKTEMDGLKRRKGVATILTTNFPELLPEALLDRSGRFHDIVEMSLPIEAVRVRMLAAWCGTADDVARTEIARATDGFSGAHLFELVHYAQSLDGREASGIEDALRKAVEKIKEQRALITSLHTPDYRPRLMIRHMVGLQKSLMQKRGRVLSAANESRLRSAQGALGEVLEQLEQQPSVDEKVLVFAEPSGGYSEQEILAEVKSALQVELAGVGQRVREETRAALARARGRVD